MCKRREGSAEGARPCEGCKGRCQERATTLRITRHDPRPHTNDAAAGARAPVAWITARGVHVSLAEFGE